MLRFNALSHYSDGAASRHVSITLAMCPSRLAALKGQFVYLNLSIRYEANKSPLNPWK